LTIALLAHSNPGKAFFSQAAHAIIAIQNSNRATPEIIFVKNQISRWTVVSLNFVSPDMATIWPMTVLSPVANTTPVQVPCAAKLEVSARLRVSMALWDVKVIDPGIKSL
jgi:hypothetical protein